MTYYAYLAHNENLDGKTWGGSPIAMVDVVRNRKDGKKRLEQLISRHPDLLPQEGWHSIQHRTLDTDDQKRIEQLKTDIRKKMASLSITTHGRRRLWTERPDAPAGCYRLYFWEANKVFLDTIRESGLYKPGR